MITSSVKFKVLQRFSKDEEWKLIGYERLNSDGNWEYVRIGRDNFILGTISDNQGNAEFKRLRYIGFHDVKSNEIYEGQVLRLLLSNGEPLDKLVRFIDSKASFCVANLYEMQYEGCWDIFSNFSSDYIKQTELEIHDCIYTDKIN